MSRVGTFEIMKNSLLSIAEEMKVVLAKTAYSPLLKLAGDYSCGLFDIHGDMVAQGPDIPIHLGSMPLAVRAVVSAFTSPKPGDVYIHNDPYLGGSHLPDVNVVTPIFDHNEKLLAYACVRAHWPDIGGPKPGSYAVVTEIFGEGLRIPPVHLYKEGKPNVDVQALIFNNVRVPEERKGDLRAQLAANKRASIRLQEMSQKYGTEQLLNLLQEVKDYSEKMMRSQISLLPDGESFFEDFCDGDGVPDSSGIDEPFWVRMKVTKKGSEIEIDFAGTDPQVSGPMNSPISVTASGIYTALKMIVDSADLIPPNSGAWKPITVKAPAGSVVNPNPPAPVVYANHEMSHRICDMTFGAMSKLVPDRVMACSQGTSAVLTFGGIDSRTNKHYVSYETLTGGMGARPIKDGGNGLKAGTSNTMNTPVEVLEMSTPVIVDRYELIEDSGGAGEFRGGCGVRRVTRIYGNEAEATVCCERTKSPPFGLMGGESGATSNVYIKRISGTEEDLNSKASFLMKPGDSIYYEVAGAGGFGAKELRDLSKINKDVANGYVSRAYAKEIYRLKDNDINPCEMCSE